MARTSDELAIAVLGALGIDPTDVYEFNINGCAGRPLRVELTKWKLEVDADGIEGLTKVASTYKLEEVK
jgi:hypothetical protein